jgi:hypothetical protein
VAGRFIVRGRNGYRDRHEGKDDRRCKDKEAHAAGDFKGMVGLICLQVMSELWNV